jgi:cobalt/nickel transport system permease protein
VHIPDGFLSGPTAVTSGVLAAAGLAVALRHARTNLAPRRVPLLGLTAAFVFAAQMVNFPVVAGTSGHLVGGVLAAVLLGPSGAVVIMASVLIVQCVLFADGGITALGANMLNMGVLGGVGGWAVFAAVRRLARGAFGLVLAASFAAWCSTMLAAVACAGELATSGTVGWRVGLTAMASVHAVIGVGEAAITALVLAALVRARPELVEEEPTSGTQRSYSALAGYGVVIALAIALFASPLASSWPDGLDRTAQLLGFVDRARPPVVPAPMPEYELPGVHWSPLATALAGGIGTLLIFGLCLLLARMLVPRSRAGEPPALEGRG